MLQEWSDETRSTWIHADERKVAAVAEKERTSLCFHCKKVGHFASQCLERRAGRSEGNWRVSRPGVMNAIKPGRELNEVNHCSDRVRWRQKPMA